MVESRALAAGIALYIHIPFCQTKCPYCDFNTYAGISHLIPRYIDALALEIRLWGDGLDHPRVNSIFLGGGTPSLLLPEQLAIVLSEANRSFKMMKGAEVTLEANPDDITDERMSGFLELGVNRLSIGVQSLEDRLLEVLGRRHSASQAEEAYRTARRAGFANVSLDLMYGLPYQDMGEWKRTLEGVVEMAPEHISAYCLTIEEGTPLYSWVRQGRFPDPDPDLAAEMYLYTEEKLGEVGYKHYEISNWAKGGCESLHNLTYWHNLSYLGVGPGAHSYIGGLRFYNLASPQLYIGRVREWAKVNTPWEWNEGTIRDAGPVEGVEVIDARLEMAETLMMGLRLDEGVSLEGFQRRSGRDLLSAYPGRVEELLSQGLLELSDGRIRLTQRGRLLGNEVFSRFLSIADGSPDGSNERAQTGSEA